MAYPPFEEYQEALRTSSREAFTDPVLASGQVVRQRSGEPLALSGNFALTYQVVTAGKRYAVRCFHKFCDALPQRYDAITRRLAVTPSPYFVDCEFQVGGIRTESGWFPLVRMDWIDGPTLGAFVADNYADSVTMQQLRASLRVLARQLAGLGIAHGDIQPGNIIVRGATDLRLIDYDGMFVPELAPLGSVELGQRNFQHPGRRWRHYHARLDSFSFAVIDVALGALAYRPDLWENARCNESAFIFRAEDFLDPWSSAAFDWVREIPGLDVKTQHLAAICQAPFDETPGIEDILAGRSMPAPRVRLPPHGFRTQRPRYVPAFAVVDAANFAQGCAHVGDRVELIGRIRRSRTTALSLADGGWIRTEFGVFPDDMMALRVHTSASQTDVMLDQLQAERWVSVIGLVEPPHLEDIGGSPCKLVSIQVDHQSQITRLSPSEAKHRLAASVRGAVVGADTESRRVGTDPAIPEPAERTATLDPALLPASVTSDASAYSPAPTSVAAPDPPPDEFLSFARRRVAVGEHWLWVGVVALTVLFVLLGRNWRSEGVSQEPQAATSRPAPEASGPPTGEPHVDRQTETAPAASVTSVDAPAGPTVERRAEPAATSPGAHATVLRSTRPLLPRDIPLTTRFGRVSFARHANLVLLQVDNRAVDRVGAPALRLVQLTDFQERIVLTGYATCEKPATDCTGATPFWLILRAHADPRVVRSNARASSASARSVTVLASGIHVDLGILDGVRRTALLTARNDPYLVTVAEPRTRLARSECAQVLPALESCARNRGCSSFAQIAHGVPAPRAAAVRRLFHETTGLNAAQFRSVCVRSCELGLTPTREYVQQRVCSGADAGQWDEPLL